MNKTIKIYDRQTESFNPPEDLQRHIAWLQAMLESIPDEFQDSACVEIDADDYTLEYTISYTRPATPEELAARADVIRQNELNLLAQLKAKYPSTIECPRCKGTGDVMIEKHICDCPECSQ